MSACKHLIKVARRLAKMREMQHITIVSHHIAKDHPVNRYVPDIWNMTGTYPDQWHCNKCQCTCWMTQTIELVKKGFDDNSIEMHGISRLIRMAEIESKHEKGADK